MISRCARNERGGGVVVKPEEAGRMLGLRARLDTLKREQRPLLWGVCPFCLVKMI